jgi:hypothetical protein
MNSPTFLQMTIEVIWTIVFLAGCTAPTVTPTLPPQPPASLPSQTPEQPTGQSKIFRYVRTVPVTPSGNFTTARFARIGYVPGRDAMIVTFDTMLAQPEGDCTNKGYAYREFNLDMVETGNQGLINCYGGAMDTGGLIEGDDFYFAYQSGGPVSGTQGWMLAKYNAVTWQPSVPMAFFGLPDWYDPGDPMIALVNGQIDISSKIMTNPNAPGDCPYVDCWTHHQFFTTDLQLVGARVLSDTIHVNLTSLVQTANGVIHFVTGTSLFGDMIVVQYDRNWNYLDTKTVKQNAGAPEGVAFDSRQFYVSYIDVATTPNNVRLAAFDMDWNLLDEIAVTGFTSQDLKAPARPSLTLHNGRIYVAYDQDEHADEKPASTEDIYVQVYVKVYDIRSTTTD